MTALKNYNIFSLKENFILSNGINRFLILNQEGKFIWDKFSEGKTEKEILEDYKKSFGPLGNDAEKVIKDFLKKILNFQDDVKNKRIETDELPLYTPKISKKYRIFGKNILLNIQSKELENIIEPPISEWEYENIHSFDIVIDFLKKENNYMVYINKKEMVRNESLPFLRGVTLYEITNTLFPNREWISVLHGSILKRKDNTILIIGESGKGKSTLTAYLVSQGYSFLSDDMVLLDKEKKVTKTPFAISLKEKSWDLLYPYIPSLKDLPYYELFKGKIKYFLPSKDQNYFLREKPNVLFLCQYEKNKETRILLPDKIDVFIHLINAGAWVSHKYEDLKIFIDWVENIPSYMLTFSNLKEAKRLIDGVIN